MTKPRLVSLKNIQKFYRKNLKKSNEELSVNFTFFLILFLMIGIAIVYYKYLIKKMNLDKNEFR